MSDIFVSYAREDRDFAREMAASLEEEGWSVWWDHSIPTGKRYHRVIEEALATVRCVIVVWSKHSVGSDWVRAEAGEGMARDVLAPVAIDASRPPLVFRQLQTADLSAWTGDNAAEEFRRLVRDIAAIAPLAEARREGTATEASAPEPEPGESRPEPPSPPSAAVESPPRKEKKRAASGKPKIVRFYAFPTYVQEGHITTLTWNVKNADRVSIDGFGEQPVAGTLEVRPEKDRKYRLVASNGAGEEVSEVQVRVRPPAR